LVQGVAVKAAHDKVSLDGKQTAMDATGVVEGTAGKDAHVSEPTHIKAAGPATSSLMRREALPKEERSEKAAGRAASSLMSREARPQDQRSSTASQKTISLHNSLSLHADGAAQVDGVSAAANGIQFMQKSMKFQFTGQPMARFMMSHGSGQGQRSSLSLNPNMGASKLWLRREPAGKKAIEAEEAKAAVAEEVKAGAEKRAAEAEEKEEKAKAAEEAEHKAAQAEEKAAAAEKKVAAAVEAKAAAEKRAAEAEEKAKAAEEAENKAVQEASAAEKEAAAAEEDAKEQDGGEGGKERPAESTIWLDRSPLLTGNLENQSEFCKAHPQAAWDKERMKASIEVVRNLTKAFRKAGIPPMINEGTLLGLYRQGFLVKGDEDIDFWVPRQFVSTPKQWNSFSRAMAKQGINCFSVFRQYSAGWKIACMPQGAKGWKLDATDSKGFYVDLSVFDEGTNGCHASPCSWTQYLTIQDKVKPCQSTGPTPTNGCKTYPGLSVPHNWRLASWHNITLWVPSDPEATLAQRYTTAWKEPEGHSGAHYNFWTQNAPIPAEKIPYYFKNVLDLSAARLLKLQERLEKANAQQIREDARKQWALAVDVCATKREAASTHTRDLDKNEVAIDAFEIGNNVHLSSSGEDDWEPGMAIAPGELGTVTRVDDDGDARVKGPRNSEETWYAAEDLDKAKKLLANHRETSSKLSSPQMEEEDDEEDEDDDDDDDEMLDEDDEGEEGEAQE